MCNHGSQMYGTCACSSVIKYNKTILHKSFAEHVTFITYITMSLMCVSQIQTSARFTERLCV